MTGREMGERSERRDGADGSRWIALYVLCVGVLMIVLDVTVVNVALPTIQDDLGFSSSNLAWVVNAWWLGKNQERLSGEAIRSGDAKVLAPEAV